VTVFTVSVQEIIQVIGHRTANWTDEAAALVEIDFVDAADPAPISDRVDVMLVLCEAYHASSGHGVFLHQFVESADKILDCLRILASPVQGNCRIEC
jgi:hypothetical protein